MKLEVENRSKAKWAIGLFAFAIILAVYNFGVGQRPAFPVPAVHDQKTATAGTVRAFRDPTLRPDLFLERQQLPYSGSSRNIFAMKEKEQINIPDTSKHEVAKDQDDKLPQINQAPLPIDLKFFGYFRKSGEPKKICISQGDTIFLAQEGSLVALHYKILEIKSNSVLVQDVLNNQQQSVALLQ